MRLIDADALGVGRCSRDILPDAYCAGWNGLIHIINSAPTINPDDLRAHGRWICKNKAYGEYECSACGGLDTDCSDYYSSHDVTEQDYCPNCGAKMDGKENEDA